MRRLATHILPVLLLIIGTLALGVGCAHRQASGEVVRNIHFRGNGGALAGTSDYSLRVAMAQERSGAFSWLAPSRRVMLDRDTLVLDAWRLETWFAHRGYFDAKFRAWDIVTTRPANQRRGPVVRIIGYVDPGPATLVRSVELKGMDIVGRPLLRLLQMQAPLQEGERFDLDAMHESVSLAENRLREQGYAYAAVTAEVPEPVGESAVPRGLLAAAAAIRLVQISFRPGPSALIRPR